MEDTRQILVVGRFPGAKKADVEDRLRLNGHTVVRSIARADLVLAGRGNSRHLETAAQRGIQILDADALASLAPLEQAASVSLPTPTAPVTPLVPARALRSVIWQWAAAPDVERAWWTLNTLLSQLPAHDLASVVDEIADDVLEWPAHKRYTHLEWLQGLLAGEAPDPRLRLAGCLLPKELLKEGTVADIARVLALRRQHMPNVRQLRINHTQNATWLPELLANGDIGDLTEFDFMYCGLGPELTTAVLAALPAERVTVLDLRSNNLGTKGARAIAAAGLSSLEWLHLYGNDIKNAGLAALCKRGALPSLRRLVVSYNHLTAKGAQSIARAPFVSQLEGLKANYNDLFAAGARALAEAPLTSLVELDLSAAEIGDEGLTALANSPHLHRLEELILEGNNHEPLICDAGAIALAESAGLPSLHTLSLARNRVQGVGLEALLRSPHRHALKVLDINNNHLRPAETQVLTESDLPVALEELTIGFYESREAPLCKLLRSAAFAELSSLYLTPPYNLQGNDRLMEALLQNPSIANLESFRTWYCSFSTAAVERLIAVPFTQLRELYLTNPKLKSVHLRLLADAPWLDQLSHVVISDGKELGDTAPLKARFAGSAVTFTAF